MNVEKFVEILGADFFTGVPDSQLKALCNYLMEKYGTDPAHHLIAANEGNCMAIAAGHYLGTGKPAVVYMQNSGEGNIINPLASLCNDKVYAIPLILVVGWRGEPGVHDEPQHVYQGEVTIKLLDDMGVKYFTIDGNTEAGEVEAAMAGFSQILAEGKQVAFVIRKNALSFSGKVEYRNNYSITREAAIKHIVAFTGEDPVISTTGKASRELYEIREAAGQSHEYDFLTVGSMGHTSSIALGLALSRPDKKVWCIDGDGSMLMHMGSMAVNGSLKPSNMVHIVINNSSHETVGGMPTVASSVSLTDIARACAYQEVFCVDNLEALDEALKKAKMSDRLCFIEVRTSIGSRADLGRPATTPVENKKAFMGKLGVSC